MVRSASMRTFATAFLMLMLIMATEMVNPIMVAEARTCSSPSHRFKGICVRNSNCAAVCQTEGFPGGDCSGARRRCLCIKPC